MRTRLRGVSSLAAIALLATGLNREPRISTAELEKAVADVEAGRKTTPLVRGPAAGGEAEVTFLARRIGRRPPRIISDVTGWGERVDGTFDFNVGTMRRVGHTEWYSLNTKVVARARIEYLIAYGLTDYRLDPHNPRTSVRTAFGASPASEFVTAGYATPEEFAEGPISPAGIVSETSIPARALGKDCRISVYTPSQYRDDGAFPVAVFLDRRSQPVSRVLDWLIARREIQPVLAVFVECDSRGGDYATGLPLQTFVTEELVNWLASRYAVTADSSQRAVLGISFSAKDALDAAFSRGEAFGKAGLLIPGRRLTPGDVDVLVHQRQSGVQVAILAGLYDRSNLPTARQVRQALTDGGHAVQYFEVAEGHNPVTCFYNLRPILVSLFGVGRPGHP